MKRPLALGVLISGGGTTLENLVVRIGDGRLRGVEIRVVVSTRSAVRGVEVVRRAALPLRIIRRRDFEDGESFSQAVTRALDEAHVGLVVMAGFLCYWHIPAHYQGRVLNIHPALLPRFGGRGMYGLHVQRAVLEAGESESGCTVHLANEQYDRGPIVAQARVPVRSDDTPEALAERVGEQERELYPAVIQRIADHGLDWCRRRFE